MNCVRSFVKMKAGLVSRVVKTSSGNYDRRLLYVLLSVELNRGRRVSLSSTSPMCHCLGLVRLWRLLCDLRASQLRHLSRRRYLETLMRAVAANGKAYWSIPIDTSESLLCKTAFGKRRGASIETLR